MIRHPLDSHFLIRAALAAACLATIVFASRAAHAEKFEIDPAQTKTTYETRYLGVFPIRGVFERMTGTLHYLPAKPVGEREPRIHVVIDATSLKPSTFDTKAKRDMVRGPEFFNVEKFPTIEFKSSEFRYAAEKLVAIDGTLTLVGVSKPVTLLISKSGCEPSTASRAARCTATAVLNVQRSQFGMTGWDKLVSDEVKIGVELVAVDASAAVSIQPPSPLANSEAAKESKPNGTKLPEMPRQ
jgi:polyisoprenoid-binding protein YceI